MHYLPHRDIETGVIGGDSDVITKPKRKRKDWVYKDQYDKLQTRFKNTLIAAYLGWGALILYVLLVLIQ